MFGGRREGLEWARLGWAVFLWVWVCGIASPGFAQDGFRAGPFYDQFPLTLDAGRRTEALGPFFYEEQRDEESTWALPPFFSRHSQPGIEAREYQFLYPLSTYEHYGQESRWHFFELLSRAGGQNTATNSLEKRFTLFPFYFQQRSPNPPDNYTALVPFYGHIHDRILRDRIFFVMFPLYGQSQRKDVVTDNYLFPFFHLRHGDGLAGWQFWPLVGHEHKSLTTKTNGFGDGEMVGGHDKFFALWPIYFHDTLGIGTSNLEKSWGVLPLYVQVRAPQRDVTTVIWPFFSWSDERAKRYHEWQAPWPFIIFARGEGKTTSRVWPLFSQSQNTNTTSISYLWPLYQYKHVRSDPLDLQRTHLLVYLYSDTQTKNTTTGGDKRRVESLPFFTYHRDYTGNRRLQILALLEPAVPDNRGIERNWSPLWSLWVSESNPRAGKNSQSLLWNLFRHESAPGVKKVSLLFGLFQYHSDPEMKRIRLGYIPVFTARPTPP